MFVSWIITDRASVSIGALIRNNFSSSPVSPYCPHSLLKTSKIIGPLSLSPKYWLGACMVGTLSG